MSGPGEAWSHRNAPGWLAGKVRWTFQPVAPALAWIAVIGLSAFLHVPSAAAQAPAGPAAADTRIVFPASVQQGAMVIGKVPPGSQVEYAGRTLRSTGYGTVVFGVGRDQAGPVQVTVRRPDGSRDDATIAVSARDWPLQHVNGVPPKTVDPPPEIAERIRREQARVAAARERDDDRSDFARPFAWPVQGRISGRFGNQRVFNGTPKSPHSGMDIAAGQGTPIKAPAAGTVTLAEKNFYLTGGTVMIDHGHGISSNFLHLSRLDVKVGDVVKQGDVVGAVGSTGRSTGPHLHWGMTWFDVKIDPLLVLEAAR